MVNAQPAVIITRSQPGADRLAQALQEQHICVISSPLTTCIAVPHEPINALEITTPKYDALLLTSPQALPAASAWAGRVPLAIVGEQAAEEAQQQGHKLLYWAENATALCGQVSAHFANHPAPRILYLHGQRVRHDITQLLPSSFKLDAKLAYRTAPLPLTEQANTCLHSLTDCMVLFQSLQAVEQFHAQCHAQSLPLAHATALCQSKVIADAIRQHTANWREILTAPQATEAAILDMLRQFYNV